MADRRYFKCDSPGSFVLSENDDTSFNITLAANWSWSADIPHHVHVSKEYVTVSRWDSPTASRRFYRRSVEDKFETFYNYLLLDKVQNKLDIITHSIDIFRRVRSYLNETNISDQASVPVFLSIIASMISGIPENAYGDAEKLCKEYDLDENYIDAFRELGIDRLNALIDQFRHPWGSPRALEVVPQILVRHAGGTVFQEAHFEFVRGGQTDMFGLPALATIKITSRGGTHFTPPGLARALVEQSFKEVNLGPTIVIIDPACGAGSFLHETLRYLQRANYSGEITLIGYDVSVSAMQMARFVVNRALADWPQANIARIQIELRNSLDENYELPQADVILMNPPFISWGGLESVQRNQVKDILGRYYVGRPDYSMAFIEKAISSLKDRGVLGTLFPASILSLEASLKWRQHILDEVDVSFLALLGDHSLFRYAIVEVACGVFTKRDNGQRDQTLVSIWSNEKTGASGEAIRNLRRIQGDNGGKRALPFDKTWTKDDWRISRVNSSILREIPDWRPKPNRLDKVLDEVRMAIDTVVDDIFHVRQGIHSGLRKVFIISPTQYQSLPRRERAFFRPIAENGNINSGKISLHEYIFYPDSEGLEPIKNENDLVRLVPTYFKSFLDPNRDELTRRGGLRSRNWWILNWARSYFVRPEPKIVSTFFGDIGSFALDLDGVYVVVQGNAWFPRSTLTQELDAVPFEARLEYRDQVFLAYLALLNSRIFSLLLAEFCPHVAGGQFNLSKRFVGRIPLPNLAALGRQSSKLGFVVASLAEDGQRIREGQISQVNQLDELVAEIYRVPITLWPITNP
jgi:adenine-specific DNA-methyltransferase